MSQVLETIVPIFILIGVAYWLARSGRLTRTSIAELNGLIFWVCLPSLIVYSLATAQSLPTGTLRILAIFSAGTLVVTILSFPVARLLGLPRSSTGTFAQAALRGNLAYIGLPVLVFAMRENPPEVLSEVLAQMMFVFAPSVFFYNVLSVALLVGSREGFSTKQLGPIILKILGNPLILACLLGAAIFCAPFRLPAVVLNTLELAGRMAAPASLFCVGGAIAFVSMKGRYRSAIWASMMKCILLPGLTATMGHFAGLTGHARLILLVLSACPIAVTSYIMVRELDGDEALAAGSIVISTLMCIPVLTIILAMCRV